MSVPFIDLKAQYARIQDDVNAVIQGVLEHGKYIMGPEIAEFESRLAAFCGAKHAITCSNGTDALSLGLMAYDVGPGDAVFTTTYLLEPSCARHSVNDVVILVFYQATVFFLLSDMQS